MKIATLNRSRMEKSTWIALLFLFLLILFIGYLFFSINKTNRSISEMEKKNDQLSRKVADLQEYIASQYVAEKAMENNTSERKINTGAVDVQDNDRKSMTGEGFFEQLMVDAEESTKKARATLHEKFDNEERDDEWADTHFTSIWNNFKEWSNSNLRNISSAPHFLIDSVECKSSTCFLKVQYDKNYSVKKQSAEIQALFYAVDKRCGYTSVAYNKIENTHEWFLECSGVE
jgi:hypothetical protein